MKNRYWVLVAALAGVIATGTGPIQAPDEGHDPALIRLWRDLAPVETRIPEPGPAPPSTDLLAIRSQPWFAVTRRAGGGVVFRSADVDGPIHLEDSGDRAVMTVVPVTRGEVLSISVTASTPATPTGNRSPLVVAVQLREPFDPSTPLSPMDARVYLDPKQHVHSILAMSLKADPIRIRRQIVIDETTEAVALYLSTPTPGDPEVIVIEDLTVQRTSAADHVIGGGSLPTLSAAADTNQATAVRIRMDGDEREALLACAPSRFAWDLPPCASPRRLSLGLGVRPQDARVDGRVRFLIQVDDDELLNEVLAAPAHAEQPAWQDRVLTLPPSPESTQRLVLATEAVGVQPTVAVFAHPTVSVERSSASPNVVLISLDTLRADRLGCYGRSPSLTPRLDALAAQALRFTRAYSTSSWTLPSHGSLLTGQYPALHGATKLTKGLSPTSSPFLASQLADAGYVTAAFTAGGFVATKYGFGHGFDRYSHNDPVWPHDTVRSRQLLEVTSGFRAPAQQARLRRYDTDSVTAWIEAQPRGVPFFAFLHTYVAHNFAPDRNQLEQHGLLPDGQELPLDRTHRDAYLAGQTDLAETVYEEFVPYYDATVGMADAFVGAVLDALERSGHADDTIVIVTSDHGEEFGEHGVFGHGVSLHDVTTRVPLIALFPGTEPGVIDMPVSLVDIAPWILTAVGIEPDSRMALSPPLGPDQTSPPGRSQLFAELDGQRGERRYSVRIILDGDLKLHATRDAVSGASTSYELFDVAVDGDELHDLATVRATDRDRLASVLERFDRYTEQVTKLLGDREPLTLDEETLRSLQQLGYLDSEDVERILGEQDDG